MIQLKINRNLYSGWEGVSITKDMLAIADTFFLSIDNGLMLQAQAGSKIEILKDNEVFLSGFIDVFSISIAGNKSPLSLNGRSKSGDLIDCKIENFSQYMNITALQIAQDIVKDFDIKISSSLTLEPIMIFDTNVGETFFNAITRLCKQNNLLPVSLKNGNIQLVKNANKSNVKILKKQDLKSLSYTSDLTGQFSKYIYKKENSMFEISDGTTLNPYIDRYRPFVDLNTEDKTNIELAQWKKNNANANGTQVSIVVNNWDFEPNTLVSIDTDIVKDTFLIKSVTYTKDNNGTNSQLILIDKGLFNV